MSSVVNHSDVSRLTANVFFHLLIHHYIIKAPHSSAPLTSLSAVDPCVLLCVIFSSRLQEVNSMINKRLKDVLFTDQWSEVCMERLSPFGYVLVSNGFYYQHICTRL